MTTSTETMTPADVVRRLFDAVNEARIEALRPLLTDDVVVHTPIPGIAPDREGFERFIGVYLSAFPTQRTEIEQMVSEGDRVAVLHTHHVCHGGDFAGIAPTGRQISVSGLELFRIDGGQIAEMWHHDDLFGLLQALAPDRTAAPAPDS